MFCLQGLLTVSTTRLAAVHAQRNSHTPFDGGQPAQQSHSCRSGSRLMASASAAKLLALNQGGSCVSAELAGTPSNRVWQARCLSTCAKVTCQQSQLTVGTRFKTELHKQWVYMRNTNNARVFQLHRQSLPPPPPPPEPDNLLSLVTVYHTHQPRFHKQPLQAQIDAARQIST